MRHFDHGLYFSFYSNYESEQHFKFQKVQNVPFNLYQVIEDEIQSVRKDNLGRTRISFSKPLTQSGFDSPKDRYPKCGKIFELMLDALGYPKGEYAVQEQGSSWLVFNWTSSTETMRLECLISDGEILAESITIWNPNEN